jgi:ABC-2 type transport system ATP-binding protein
MDMVNGNPPMNEIAIRTRGLSKQYNKVDAVRDVSLDVAAGAIFGFIGPSGSGKTTTIRMLIGIEKPDEGEVSVLGQSPAEFDRRTRFRIGYMPQNFVLYPDLTVRENLSFAASIYGMNLRRSEEMRRALDLVELVEHQHKPVNEISGGMQRRLSLAATLIHSPSLCFLDEPTTGIDPVLREKFWQRFKELQADGRTLFITTQYVSEAAYCDQVALLLDGRILTIDSPEGLRMQAFGGDMIRAETEQHIPDGLILDLQEESYVRSVMRRDPHRIEIGVEEAGTDTAKLINWFEKRSIDITFIEEYVPSFDDVFVSLVKRHRAGE